VLESLLVLAILAAVIGTSLLIPMITGPGVVIAGAICVLVGMLFGLPTGAWYHVKLHGVLAARDELRSGWWLHPTAFHARLHADERARVMPWFYAGGAGFGLIVLGCAAMLVGLYVAA
jgi:hypothetical protein